MSKKRVTAAAIAHAAVKKEKSARVMKIAHAVAMITKNVLAVVKTVNAHAIAIKIKN